MTFHKTPEDSNWKLEVHADRTHCFGCGRRLNGPTIEYHGNARNKMLVILMHPKCAKGTAKILLDDVERAKDDDSNAV